MNIMIVDDNKELLESMKIFLELKGFNIIASCTNSLEAIVLCEEYNPDVILMDVNMPKYDGFFGLKNIKKINQDVKIIIMTGMTHKKILDKIQTYEPYAILIKPCPLKMLVNTIKSVN